MTDKTLFVVPRIMKNFSLVSLILFSTAFGCARNDYVVRTGNDASHAILNMELVEIPSKGTVTWITGNAEIKKNGTNEYVTIRWDTTINENDIVWLKKEAKVKIAFEDGTFRMNDSQAKDVFITFDLVKTDKSPK